MTDSKSRFEAWATTMLWKNLDHKNCADAAWQSCEAQSAARIAMVESARDYAVSMLERKDERIAKLEAENERLRNGFNILRINSTLNSHQILIVDEALTDHQGE